MRRWTPEPGTSWTFCLVAFMKHLLCADPALWSSAPPPHAFKRRSVPVARTGEGAGGAGRPLAQGWEDLRLRGHRPQRLAPAAEPRALQMPSSCPAPEGADGGGGTGRGGGCPRRWAGQPPQPHPLPPADALGTHWTLRTPTRKPNWETKAGRRGQTLTDVVGGSGQAARRGPQRGRGRGREWA